MITAIAITIPTHRRKKDSRANLRCAPEYFGVNGERIDNFTKKGPGGGTGRVDFKMSWA